MQYLANHGVRCSFGNAAAEVKIFAGPEHSPCCHPARAVDGGVGLHTIRVAVAQLLFSAPETVATHGEHAGNTWELRVDTLLLPLKKDG